MATPRPGPVQDGAYWTGPDFDCTGAMTVLEDGSLLRESGTLSQVSAGATMPFDGLIYGGFEMILEQRKSRPGAMREVKGVR